MKIKIINESIENKTLLFNICDDSFINDLSVEINRNQKYNDVEIKLFPNSEKQVYLTLLMGGFQLDSYFDKSTLFKSKTDSLDQFWRKVFYPIMDQIKIFDSKINIIYPVVQS